MKNARLLHQKIHNPVIYLMSLIFIFALPLSEANAEGMKIFESPLQSFVTRQYLKNPATHQEAELVNLNTIVNTWYVLRVSDESGRVQEFHLEAFAPHSLIGLKAKGLLISNQSGTYECEVFGTPLAVEFTRAKGAFSPICGGLLYLRKQVAGHESYREVIANGARDNFGALGKFLVEKTKEIVAPDSEEARQGQKAQTVTAPTAAPESAQMDHASTPIEVPTHHLGIETLTQSIYGNWASAKNFPGVFVSLFNPGLIDGATMSSYPKNVSPLTPVEKKALVYLVAFDSTQFELGYALGSNHPGLEWSHRPPRENFKDKDLPGPDGFDRATPLGRVGMVSPNALPRTLATFVGGFKREHAAFRYGALANTENGHHSGFAQNGVIFSKLQPQLATAFIDLKGRIDLLTWPKSTLEQAELLKNMLHARQNGVPIIDGIDESGVSKPGVFVNRWEGSWSGDAKGDLVSQRSGLCIQQKGDKKFVIFAYFTGASPNLMARVFQAYHCRYAMLLDMNAFEHTFLALSRPAPEGGSIMREYLHKGMKAAEPSGGFRFLTVSDNRDFFYVLRKEQ